MTWYRKHIVLGMALLCCAAFSYGGSQTPDQPNILFIFSDDQCWNTIGRVGGDVQTPALDRLVDEGTFFSHTYNQGAWQGAVCIASRTMLMTGLDVWKAGVYSSADAQNPADFWSTRFKEAGYKTYFAGKWHVMKISPNTIYDVTGTIQPGMPAYEDPSMGGEISWKVRAAGYFRPEAPGIDNWDPSDPQFGGFWKGGKHWSEVLGDEGVGFIEEAATSKQPFFMQLAFNAPHDPRQAPKKYVDMYPLESIEVPENFMPENPHMDAMEVGRGLRDEDLAPFPRSEHAIKTHRQEYFAIITHMDEQIARIIRALEETGQRDNTIIVFTSDHGLAVGQHGLLGKQNMFEHSLKPPLLFVGNGIPRGKTIDTPVYMQDLMPTTLEMAGIEIPESVDFRSLLPVLEGRDDEQDRVMYGAYKNKQRMVLKQGKKLIWYPTSNTYLLFDIIEDPLEMNDLYANPAYAAVAMELMQELKNQQALLNDPMLTGAAVTEDGVVH